MGTIPNPWVNMLVTTWARNEFSHYYFEENFSGGAGVVLDDIMAGVLAALLLKMVHLTGVL